MPETMKPFPIEQDYERARAALLEAVECLEVFRGETISGEQHRAISGAMYLLTESWKHIKADHFEVGTMLRVPNAEGWEMGKTCHDE